MTWNWKPLIGGKLKNSQIYAAQYIHSWIINDSKKEMKKKWYKNGNITNQTYGPVQKQF